MSTNATQKSNIVSNYFLERTIGEGTFGKVKLAKHIPTNEYVAIKILEKSKIHDKEELERVEKEIKYLKTLNHPNIIQIYEIIENSKNFYIVMEYANNGELFNYIVKKEKLNELEASYFFSQIIHGIAEIHKYKICHRDIKPENILLTNKNILKIIDFGLSNQYDKYLSTPCGSPCYASPEMIHGSKYNGLAIDLWASGVILFAMVCGYLPFDDKNNEKLFAKILRCKIEFPSEDETLLTNDCKDLILRILTPNPNKRIKLDEVMVHPFLAYGNMKYSQNIKEEHFTQEDFLINYMAQNLNIDNKNNSIKKALMNNRHNNVTTTFKLLKKKLLEGRFSNTLSNSENLNPNLQLQSKLLSFRSNVPKRAKQSKRKYNVTTSVSSSNSMLSEINSVITDKNLDQRNIIIINNTNMISQPVKMNRLYDKLIPSDNQVIRKIDTSVSTDKSKPHPSVRDTSTNRTRTVTPIKEKIYTKKPTAIKKRNRLYLPLNTTSNAVANKTDISKRAVSDPSHTEKTVKKASKYNFASPANSNILKANNHYRELISTDRVYNGTSIKKSAISDISSIHEITSKKYEVYSHKVNTLTLKKAQYQKKSISPHTKANTTQYHTNYLTESAEKRFSTATGIPTSSGMMYARKRKTKNDNNVIVFQKPKNSKNFIFYSSSLPLEEGNKKLCEYCQESQMKLVKDGRYSYIITIKEINEIKIELGILEGSTVVKMYHLLGNEEITSIYMRQILVNVGF